MNTLFPRFLTSWMVATTLVWVLPAAALSPPVGPVILTIVGKVSEKNRGDAVAFDLAMLEKLPQKSFTTRTPWDKEPVKFSGPLLRDVLLVAKASGTTLKAVALNDYKTAIPMSDTQKYDVILAHRINDQPISVRTKGPLYIIYPFDTLPELQSAIYYERSAWQLKSIDIE